MSVFAPGQNLNRDQGLRCGGSGTRCSLCFVPGQCELACFLSNCSCSSGSRRPARQGSMAEVEAARSTQAGRQPLGLGSSIKCGG